jgi:hypothetical protein
MRSLAAGALALLAGGCLKAEVNRCGTGAICKDDQACTEWPVCKPDDASCVKKPLCGPPDLVAQCFDDAKAYDGCTVNAPNDGACVDRICTACTDDLAGCGTSSWNVMTLPPQLPALKSIWMVSKTYALAGGAQGTLLEYDGRGWHRMDPAPSTTSDITRIFATSSRDIYLVSATSEVLHFDGAGWSDVRAQMSAGGAITSIHGTAPNNVYAAGVGATLMHFDGSVWTAVGPASGPTPTLLAVVATSAGATAVGAGGAVVTWDGSTSVLAQPMPSPYTTDELFDVFAHGSKLVAASSIIHSGKLSILEGSGATWSLSMFDTGVAQEAVHCAADDYAGANSGHVYHYDGTTWSLPTDGPSSTARVVAVSRADGYVFAVADGPAIWRRRDL